MTEALHHQIIEKPIVAVRAAIIKDKKLLVIRESDQYEEGTQEGKYDFPGGCLDIHETVTEALKREVQEEVGLEIDAIKPFFVGEWHPVVKERTLHIVGIFFLCTARGDVVLGNDHDDFRWIGKEEHRLLTMVDPVPAAIATLIKEGIF